MRSYLCGTIVLAGLAMGGAVCAEPLEIIPYPSLEKEQGQAVFEVQQAPDVQQAQHSVFSSRVGVPQPGDPYFDPPSQDSLMAVVEEPAKEMLDVDVPQEGGPLPVESVAGASEVQVGSLSGALDKEKAVAEVQNEPYEPLVVRMSDNIDEWVVPSGDEPVLAAPFPVEDIQVEEARAAESAVSEKQAPILDVSPPAVETSEETIVWNGDRVPVNTPIPAVDLEPASGAGQADAGLRWHALEGQNIRQALEGWSQTAGVELIWDNVNAFAVLEPFEIRGDYEQAVQMLLDQYRSSEVRPVATLHVDPQSQQKTLVVRIVEGG